MKKIFTKLLGIPEIVVEDSKEIDNTIILTVKASIKKGICPRCGQVSHRLHQNKYHLVKDLPISGKEVILKVNRRQFKCDTCQKPFSEKLNFVGEKKNFTKRYAEKITEQVIHSDVKNVALSNRLTDEQVWSMVIFITKSMKPINLDNLKRLGIDEISLVKGQGKFIVVLVDLEKHKLIGLVSSRTQSEIRKTMEGWGEKVLSKIEEVSIDMTGNYKSLVKKICPNAEITIDRFYVTKKIHEELNQARIEQKKTAETLNAKERAKLFTSLKGSKYTLLKKEENLSEKQKEKLEQAKEASPLIEIMHNLKEEFGKIFDESKSLGEGTLRLIDWLKKAEKYYRQSVKTIKRWLVEIVGYFESKTTSGVVEGINNKLKLIKRCAFGFNNFKNFEIRALLNWHFYKNLAY
ncbi:ISL3 family transposase [Gloeocapsa sp. PCC 73106]|uniref:ISL3 family transposase n=1 Tax=Gloeocapsa sp. PCC 73106 TaxID=102232 RepID=UPI0002ABC1C8|nr:ISL3 family transposase [Gloeocapsa sp. PCC 73106]ELR97900.1 transposase family protein [Gloeocapsa sp. PCC 73106]